MYFSGKKSDTEFEQPLVFVRGVDTFQEYQIDNVFEKKTDLATDFVRLVFRLPACRLQQRVPQTLRISSHPYAKGFYFFCYF